METANVAATASRLTSSTPAACAGAPARSSPLRRMCRRMVTNVTMVITCTIAYRLKRTPGPPLPDSTRVTYGVTMIISNHTMSMLISGESIRSTYWYSR